jgi:hypothetical protein
MPNEENYNTVLTDLRRALSVLKPGQRTFDEIVSVRDQVFAQFQPIFRVEHLPSLARDEFTSFLYFENNHHWSGLYRQGLGAASDMTKLRTALQILLDEGQLIRDDCQKRSTRWTESAKALQPRF